MNVSDAIIPFLLTSLAGLSTVIGSFIAMFIKNFGKKHLCLSLGFSSGVMVYVAFAELLATAIQDTTFLAANLAFFSGIIFMMLVDKFIPHEYLAEHAACCKGKRMRKKDMKLMCAGVFTAIGIFIHNFPEGLAVFMGALSDISLGIPLAFAIALHNIPEGIAIAMPIYYATKSRSKAFWYSFFSGVAEPIGAIVAFFILLPFLNPVVLSLTLAFVGGIMIFITFDELLPLSYQEEHVHIAIMGIIAGMAVMAFSLYLF
jgi:ZIP family zinc transporter